jgi:hypothetical protein
VSTDYVFSISSSVLSEQGGIPLASSTPAPRPMMVSFDWNDLVEPHLPSSAPFQTWMILGDKFLSWAKFPWFFQKRDSLF